MSINKYIEEEILPKAVVIARNFIAQREGVKLKAYLDTANIPTIGYGSIFHPNGKAVRMGETITMQQAIAYFDFELTKKANQLLPHLTFNINENQLASMLSFAYNAGVGKKGKLGDAGIINKMFFNTFATTGDTLKAAALLEKTALTSRGQKKPTKGLVNRRKHEAELFKAPSTIEKKKFSRQQIANIFIAVSNNFWDFFTLK